MLRAGILASFVAVTLASSTHFALAQASAAGDSVARSAAESAPVVDTASRKLPVASRELLFENCAGRAQNPLGYVLPLLCGRRAGGAFDFAGGDSVILVRNGRAIRLAARDFTLLGQLERRRRIHAVTGAFIGGSLGLISAAFVKGSGPHPDDGRIATTVVLGGLGAVIGGFSVSRYWGDWPRTLQDLQH